MNVKVSKFPGRTLEIANQSYLYFGGTSYLGIQTDQEFRELVMRSIQQFGSNYGASRRSNVQVSIYQEAESYLAQWVGSESAITMSSGYLSGQLIASHFNSKQYTTFYAPNSHSALYNAQTKPYTTYTTLNIALRTHLDKNKEGIPVIFLDSIDFSGCNYPDFDILKTMPLSSCILVVDDSHGIGVVGNNGAGVFNTLKSLPCKELIVCASLGKALGLQAGAIFGTSDRLELLKASNFFGGASPAAPFYLAHFMMAESIYANKRNVLLRHISHFLSLLKAKDLLNYMPEYPVFGFSDPELSKHLRNNHILVTDFRYPTEDTNATHRIVLNAGHRSEDIEQLAATLNSFKI